MSDRRLPKKKFYKMTNQELQSGVGYILDNAIELAKDCQELLNAKRPYHVISLLEAAIQELGKAVMLQRAHDRAVDGNMERVMKGEILGSYLVLVSEKDFKNHDKKHQLGIELLDTNARRVMKQEFDYSNLSEGIRHKLTEYELGERLRLSNIYVNWIQNEQQRGWEIPSTMTLGSFDVPQQIYDTLKTTTDAIIKAIENFHRKYP